MGADVVFHKSQIWFISKMAKRTKKVGIVGKYGTRYVHLSERISRSLKFRVIEYEIIKRYY